MHVLNKGLNFSITRASRNSSCSKVKWSLWGIWISYNITFDTDYKLMASVLSNRLKRSLHDTIGNYQKGEVPGRLLTDNLCLYRDVIQYVDDRSKPEEHSFSSGGMKAGIIGVDLEKRPGKQIGVMENYGSDGISDSLH